MASLRLLRRARGERGAELIEFALVFPMLLLVMLGIIDFGFLFQRYLVVTNAAREGARIAVLAGYNTQDVENRVKDYFTASGITVTPTNPYFTHLPAQGVNIGGTCMTLVGVQVHHPHNYLFLGPIVGLLGGSSFTNKTLTATVRMRREGAAAAY